MEASILDLEKNVFPSILSLAISKLSVNTDIKLSEWK